MENSINRETTNLNTYFKSYLEGEPIQKAEEAAKDSQLGTLALTFQEILDNNNFGTIVDIGCGEGALLSYFCEKMNLKERRGWVYYAVDFKENFEKVSNLAFQKNVNRKAEFIELKEFYNVSIRTFEPDSPIIFVCRNVMHELDIEWTTTLLQYLMENTFDLLILQDLMNFKQGERGNVCWDDEILKNLLEKLGFRVVMAPIESKSKAKWLSAKVTKDKEVQLNREQINKFVVTARSEQYDNWTKNFFKSGKDLLTIDRDLQIAALASQLKECEITVSDYEPDSKVVLDTLQCKLVGFCGEIDVNDIDKTDNFRDRAHIQDELEKELQEKQSRIQIVGGLKIGKTYLVNRLLSRRAYGKPVISIDLMKTSNVWSVLEQIFEKIGIHISSKTFITLRKVEYKDIQSLMCEFFKVNGENLIIVVNYLERILTEEGEVEDTELRQFIQDITKSPIYSIFFLSRAEYRGINSEVYIPHYLSLFPEEKHVTNLLDDYINRGEYHIDAYPEELINAIGRHPYMAYIAAKVIKKSGVGIIDDEKFLDEIKLKLHKELMKRLIDEKTMPAMQVLQYVRSMIPFEEAKQLCDANALEQCINDGVIVEKWEYRERMICCACEMDMLSISEIDESDIQIISRIAEAYGSAYRRTDNPVFLRETIYYNVCSQKKPIKQLGKMYYSEIKAAADYWYQKRDYGNVVWACEFLEEIGAGSTELLILKAASLMRMPNRDKVEEGNAIFLEKVNRKSIYAHKSKYIDSLLYVGDFQVAKDKLEQLGFDEKTCQGWQAYQFGCVYLGLSVYDKAILYLNKALASNKQRVFYLKIARAYYCMGEFEKEVATLKKAYDYTKDSQIKLNYAMALLRSAIKENVLEAGRILKELYESMLKGDINVAVIYCRFLCRTGNLNEANQIYCRYSADDKWKVQSRTMELDISMARRNWKRCEQIIEDMCVDEEYKKGLQKRLYLYIARTDNSEEYAKKGLDIKIPSKYKRNVPFRLTHCSLAKLLGRVDILANEKKCIQKINKNLNIENLADEDLNDILADDFI